MKLIFHGQVGSPINRKVKGKRHMCVIGMALENIMLSPVNRTKEDKCLGTVYTYIINTVIYKQFQEDNLDVHLWTALKCGVRPGAMIQS